MTDTFTKDQIFAMIAEQRRAVADVMEGLSAEQWATPSLCGGWTVRDVAAHLVMPFELSTPQFVGRLLTHRFKFDKMSNSFARADTRSGGELAKVLRANAEHRFVPPNFPPQAPLTDIVTHGMDMFRPLGIERDIPSATLRTVLNFLMTPKATKAFVPKSVVEGRSFVATDVEWSAGSGTEVLAPAQDLVLTLTGRRAVPVS
jgi:uncharacterized protein (TIGR03083 family)